MQTSFSLSLSSMYEGNVITNRRSSSSSSSSSFFPPSALTPRRSEERVGEEGLSWDLFYFVICLQGSFSLFPSRSLSFFLLWLCNDRVHCLDLVVGTQIDEEEEDSHLVLAVSYLFCLLLLPSLVLQKQWVYSVRHTVGIFTIFLDVVIRMEQHNIICHSFVSFLSVRDWMRAWMDGWVCFSRYLCILAFIGTIRRDVTFCFPWSAVLPFSSRLIVRTEHVTVTVHLAGCEDTAVLKTTHTPTLARWGTCLHFAVIELTCDLMQTTSTTAKRDEWEAKRWDACKQPTPKAHFPSFFSFSLFCFVE